MQMPAVRLESGRSACIVGISADTLGVSRSFECGGQWVFRCFLPSWRSLFIAVQNITTQVEEDDHAHGPVIMAPVMSRLRMGCRLSLKDTSQSMTRLLIEHQYINDEIAVDVSSPAFGAAVHALRRGLCVNDPVHAQSSARRRGRGG